MRYKFKRTITIFCVLFVSVAFYWITKSHSFMNIIQSDKKNNSEYWKSHRGIKEVIAMSERQKKAEAKKGALKKTECERYFESLKQPIESPEEIAALIAEGYDQNNFKRKVDWYVYNGNPQVINAAISDLPHRWKIDFFKNQEGKITCVEIENIGGDIATLDGCYGANRQVGPILHEALHKYSKEKDMPDLIYLLIEKLGDPSFEEYYTDESVKKDILSYLRIYINYTNYLPIKSRVEALIHNYGNGKWHWDSDMSKVYELANKEGLEAAFNYYMAVFKQQKPTGSEISIKNSD